MNQARIKCYLIDLLTFIWLGIDQCLVMVRKRFEVLRKSFHICFKSKTLRIINSVFNLVLYRLWVSSLKDFKFPKDCK